jgi:GDPmannose 4,6-dehydratase
MWRMLQQDEPDDYVLATGIKITVREFINMSFAEVGIKVKWEGKGEKEKGIDTATGKVLVEIDPKYYRPAEVDLLVGDATKARTKMGWTPTYTVAELCKEMMQADLELFRRDKYLLEGGHKVLNYKE